MAQLLDINSRATDMLRTDPLNVSEWTDQTADFRTTCYLSHIITYWSIIVASWRVVGKVYTGRKLAVYIQPVALPRLF